MKQLRRIIDCADKREFGKLTKEQVEFAHRITVGGTVVKSRPASSGGAAR